MAVLRDDPDPINWQERLQTVSHALRTRLNDEGEQQQWRTWTDIAAGLQHIGRDTPHLQEEADTLARELREQATARLAPAAIRVARRTMHAVLTAMLERVYLPHKSSRIHTYCYRASAAELDYLEYAISSTSQNDLINPRTQSAMISYIYIYIYM